MTWEQIYFSVCGAVLVLTVLIFWVAVIMPGMNQWNKRFFVTLFAIFVLNMIAFFVDFVFYDDPSMTLAGIIVGYFEYLLITIPMPMFTAYLLRTCGERLAKEFAFPHRNNFVGHILYPVGNRTVYNVPVLLHAR